MIQGLLESEKTVCSSLDLVKGEKNSLQGLACELRQSVAPGRNITTHTDLFLREQRDQELPIEPCPRTVCVLLR